MNKELIDDLQRELEAEEYTWNDRRRVNERYGYYEPIPEEEYTDNKSK